MTKVHNDGSWFHRERRRRVALCYDLCSPFTVGGAETHYRGLGAELASRGHRVTYLTSRYWSGSARKSDGQVSLFAVTRGNGPETGNRSILAALRYAWGLMGHLLRHGSEYDVVEVAALPPTSAIAAWVGLLPHRQVLLITDWHEVWRLATWRGQFGLLGSLGWLSELAARRVGVPVSFSKLHANRLPHGAQLVPEFISVKPRQDGLSGGNTGSPQGSVLLCVGRLVEDKRFALLPQTLAALRRIDPAGDWSGIIVGSGPQRELIQADAERLAVDGHLSFESNVSEQRLTELFASSTVLFHPSRREGFGIVVLEASAHGLPVVLVGGPDNAAVELVSSGINGFVSQSDVPDELALAVVKLAQNGDSKASVREWWEANRARFTPVGAADAVERAWSVTN